MVRCEQIERVPIVVEKDGIRQIAYRFGENAPHVWAGFAAEAQTEPIEEEFEFGEHGACLRCRLGVEVHSTEGGFVIDF